MKRSLIAAIVVGTVVLHGTAFGQAQTKGQQKCINAMNKSMAKVAKTQDKANAKCVKARAKDGTTAAFDCASTDAKVDAAKTKTIALEDKTCASPEPTFGYTSGAQVNSRAAAESVNLMQDLFDDDMGIALCDSDKDACKCQGKLYKSATKLSKTYMKVYNKCKKSGLADKDSPIIDAAQLATCISTDPQGKLDKALGKLDTTIAKNCATAAFTPGDCGGVSGPDLWNCVDERVRCHACLTEAISDDLSFDCDVFDNGNDDGSCFDDF